MTTTDPTLALARRAVACPGWRWMPGVLDTDGNRYQWRHVNRQAESCGDREGAAFWVEPDRSSLPDLADPATLGCLLALVRERWGPLAHLVRLANHHQPNGPGTALVPTVSWALSVDDNDKPLMLDLGERRRYFVGPTEAGALVAALEHESTP